MLNLFKPKKFQQKNSDGPSIDGVNINNLAGNYSPKNSPQENNFLEIKIISSGPDFQEIEITCGKKKIHRRIYKNFLPKNLASNFVDEPSKSLGAINLNSLNQHQKIDNLVFTEKLLNALAKINLLNQANKIESSQVINYQKIWDGDARIAIDQKFLSLSKEEKQQAFDQEILRRENYLTTPDKAILLAAFNKANLQNYKIDRDIISQNFTELTNNNSFYNFITGIFSLIENKTILIQHFFSDSKQNLSTEKTNILIASLDKIFAEPNKERRHDAIKTFKNLTKHKTSHELSK